MPKVSLPTLMTLMLRSTGWHRKAKRNLYPFRVCFNQDLAIFLVPSQPYHSGFFLVYKRVFQLSYSKEKSQKTDGWGINLFL